MLFVAREKAGTNRPAPKVRTEKPPDLDFLVGLPGFEPGTS